MKTPDEIKKGLECCAEISVCSECPYYNKLNFGGGCVEIKSIDAMNYIRQLENHIGELTEKVAQLEAAQPKWISVEERLPDDDVDVIVYIASKKENVDSVIAITQYTHSMYGYNLEGWCSPWQYCFWDRKVTHWMPIPQMPKEGA